MRFQGMSLSLSFEDRGKVSWVRSVIRYVIYIASESKILPIFDHELHRIIPLQTLTWLFVAGHTTA